MDIDDELPRAKSDTVKALQTEDLASHSVHELEERVAALEAEIARAKALIDKKQDSKAAADAVFK